MRRLLLAAAPLALAVVGCFGVGCANGGPPVADDVEQDFPTPPPLASGDVQVETPELTIKPGQDVAWCYVPEYTPETDIIVKRALSYQGKSGHHMAIYESGIPRKTGDLFDCTSLDTMATMLPMVIPDKGNVDKQIMPDGFGVKVPKGTQIVLQAHIINVNLKTVKTKGVIQLHLAAPGEQITLASYWVMSDDTIKLPTGTSSRTLDCNIQNDTKIVFQLGHMHEWGKSITVTRDHNGVTDTLYHVDQWTAQYRDNGPTNSYPVNDPVVLAAGDTVHLTCTWDNNTGAEIDWPKEMCVTLGAYFPARGDGFIDCNDPIGTTVDP